MSHNFTDGGSDLPFQGRSLTLKHTWKFERLDLLVPPDFLLPKGWVMSACGLIVSSVPQT